MTDDFWSRDELAHIRDFARSRRTNPFSTLAVVLVRACCMIPPGAVLPPIIGGAVAPNLFAALVGDSGAGKNASEAVGRDAISWNTENNLAPVSPGSGEGIARTLMGDPTALFVASEVDTLGALFARKGQTLEPELRKLYMGEHLGFANAGKDTRTAVDALMYRAGLIVGVQPLRAGTLLHGRDGGTPQRFLWAPVRDLDMPTTRPARMDPLTVTPPSWTPGRLREIKVCDPARDEIEQQYIDYHRGTSGVDPLDGHTLLTRLKVAAGLMVLAERCDGGVTDDDWSIAGQIMAVSRATRAAVVAAAEEARRRSNTARAADTLERDDFIGDSKVRKAKRALMRRFEKVRDGEVIPHHELRRTLNSNTRDEFDPAIIELLDEGHLSKVQLDRGYGYVRSTAPRIVHGTPPAETAVDYPWSRGTTPRTPSRRNGAAAATSPDQVNHAIKLGREFVSKQKGVAT